MREGGGRHDMVVRFDDGHAFVQDYLVFYLVTLSICRVNVARLTAESSLMALGDEEGLLLRCLKAVAMPQCMTKPTQP